MTTLPLSPRIDDFVFQADFVVDAAWRLLSMQDQNPVSPSYGCFHYSFWRDKTSEFADARFQEAGATLGLLSLGAFDFARDDGRLPSSQVLYDGFSAGAKSLARQQYPDGCFDEWYKGERGFAATEFTTIAYGLACRHLGDRIAFSDRKTIAATIARSGNWLSGRHDRTKANHEAAAAAALALAWDVTGENRFRLAARNKIDDLLTRQTGEGWFPEIGSMDLGYSSVLLDYVMLYALVTGDDYPVPSMSRLLQFMIPHLHPDGTISAEAGICFNPYVSRVGIGLLSAHDKSAAAIVNSLSMNSPGTEGVRSFLADDLRLVRWSHLPLSAYLLRSKFSRSENASASLRDIFPRGWTINPQAHIASHHCEDIHVYFSPGGGAAIRVYIGHQPIMTDRGIFLATSAGTLCIAGRGAQVSLRETDGGVLFSTRLGEPRFVFPGFLSRLILRIACTVPQISYLARRLIDWFRLRRKTAINQSVAPVVGWLSDVRFTRAVSVSSEEIRVLDRIQGGKEKIKSSDIQLLLEFGHTRIMATDIAATAPSFTVDRKLSFVAADPSLTVRVYSDDFDHPA